MSDNLPSCCCPKGLYHALLGFLIVYSSLPAFAHNDPNLPRSASEQMMQLREYIAGYAQNFVGIEYRHGGQSTAKGFDCSGFTSFALNEFGIQVSAASSAQATQGDEVSLDAVLPGDLVFFGRRGRVTHVALVVQRTEEGIVCVHSTCSRGIMVENISTSSYWRPKIMFARDVITRQALEKNLLTEPVAPTFSPAPLSFATTEEWSDECAEEFEKNCQSVAPAPLIASLDLQAQFRQLMSCR